MSTGKRVRDPETEAIRNAFQALLHEVTAYGERLAAEQAEERGRSDPYPHLVAALDRQIAQVQALATLLDEDVLEQVIGIANTSGYVAHARTRDFF